MLKKVGQACFPRFFILGTDVVPDVDRDYGGFVIFVNDDGEAVIEGELLAGDFEG